MKSGSSSSKTLKKDGGENDAPSHTKEITKKTTPEQRIRILEAGIRQNMIRNCNNLVDLIAIVKRQGPATSKAVHAVRRAIVLLHDNASSKEFKQWVNTRLHDYGAALICILRQESLSPHHDACVASAALSLPSVFQMLVMATLVPALENDQLNVSGEDKDEEEGGGGGNSQATLENGVLKKCVKLIYLSVAKFSDLAHIAFTVLASKDEQGSAQQLHLRIALLKAASQSPMSSENAAVRKIPLLALKKSRTSGWMSILKDDRLTLSQRSHLVARLPTDLLPHMTQPLQLADFLTACYDASAKDASHLSLSLSSLHGLFLLISKQNLDYPRFFHKLYALLSADTFCTNAKDSHQFRSLAAAFLIKGGTRTLPRNTAAAFVKRLVRRSLTAPSAHSLWTLRLALELLRTYPATSFLVHAPTVNLFESDSSAVQSKKRPRSHTLVSDPFDDSQNDPEMCNVEQSSLWELEILANHFSPAVSRLVTLFSSDMRQRPPPLPGTLEDYATLDFSDLWHAEVKRRSKALHVSYEKPGSAELPEGLGKVMKSAMSWS